jgi:hypothetical protein
MAKQQQTDYSIRLEMSENGGIILHCMDRDEPMEDKTYTFKNVDEAVAKIKSLLGEEEQEEKSEVPQTKDDVKKHLHTKNMGSTMRQMKGAL